MGTGDRGLHQVTHLPRCGPGGLGRRRPPSGRVLRHCWTLCPTLASLCSRPGPGQGWRVTADQRPLHRGTSVPIPGRGCSGLCREGVGQGRGQPGRCRSQAPGPAPSSHQTSPSAQPSDFSDHLRPNQNLRGSYGVGGRFGHCVTILMTRPIWEARFPC